MVLNWVLYIGFGVLAYVGISLMGQLGSGPAESVWRAALNVYRPLTLMVMLVANGLWILAVYYGLRQTSVAIPALIALGVVVSFGYSVLFLGAEPTVLKAAGLTLILAGIYLLV